MDRRIYDRYIRQIVEHGSLTKAAASLGLSQPALSSGLTNLENDLGFKIFNRKSIPITFTAEGELYFEYIRKLEVLSEDFRRRIDDYREREAGKVVIGGPVAYVESMVTDAVITFRKKHPNYSVAIKCSPLSELIEMASKGEINCFISTREEMPGNFEKRLIKQEKIYLCIPRDNPLNDTIAQYRTTAGNPGPYFDYSLLDGETFLFLEEGQPLQIQTELFLKQHGITPENKVVVNQVSTAVNLAVKGEGICFASEAALAGAVDLSSVCIYALPSSISGRNIYVAYNKDLFMPEACRELIRYLMDKHFEN